MSHMTQMAEPAIKYMDEDGSSCIRWMLFAPDATEEQIEEHFDEPEGREIRSAYDCTGRSFAHPVRVRRTQTRALVTQWWGIDV